MQLNAYIQKAEFADNLEFPQKDCLRTRKLSNYNYVMLPSKHLMGWLVVCPSAIFGSSVSRGLSARTITFTILTFLDNFDNFTISFFFVYNFYSFGNFWLDTCGLWDIAYNYDNREPEFTTSFVTWQLRVTLDSIRNSCDVHLGLGESNTLI